MHSQQHLLRSVIRALRFDGDYAAELTRLDETEWEALLRLTDENRLTLPAGIRRRRVLPENIRRRIDTNLADNARRYLRAIDTHAEIIDALGRRRIDFLVLKGLSHFPGFCVHPAQRQQYDIDLYCPPEQIHEMLDAVQALGYEPVVRRRTARTDHLAPMIRKTGWRWAGNYYDPEMPLHIELHFRLWDGGMEMFEVATTGDFWSRRTNRCVGGILIPTLDLKDTIRYAAWHLTRHLLRGDLLAGHVYEFACFLENTVANDVFWANWNDRDVRTMLPEAIAARLASACFGCRLNMNVRCLIERLPLKVSRWFDLFSDSPLLRPVHPNKDELFLHLLLATRLRDRLRIALRRLIPALPASIVIDPHVAASQACRTSSLIHNSALLSSRTRYHVQSLGPLVRSGLRWLMAPHNPV